MFLVQFPGSYLPVSPERRPTRMLCGAERDFQILLHCWRIWRVREGATDDVRLRPLGNLNSLCLFRHGVTAFFLLIGYRRLTEIKPIFLISCNLARISYIAVGHPL
jgi:hypothetical protein